MAEASNAVALHEVEEGRDEGVSAKSDPQSKASSTTDKDSEFENDVAAAWKVEIERRVAELDAGTVETIPWEIVRDHLRQRLRR